MIITNNGHFRNSAENFYPTKSESRYIQYLLNMEGFSLTKISNEIKVSVPTVFNIIYGRRRSRRVEAEIARILGHAEWNDLVIEARLAVSGVFKPTKAQINKAKKQAIKNRQELIKQKRNAFKQTLKEAV